MLVRDIDKKLDMRIVLRLREDTDLFNSTRGMTKKLPVYIYGFDGETWMATYFPKADSSSKMDLIFKKFDATELENSFVVDSRINNVKDLKVINKLMDVPSFVINRSDMGNGFLYVYARFHNSQLRNVSSLLAEYTADSLNSRIDWLGPSNGILAITDLINKEYPISLVSYRVPIGADDRVLKEVVCEQGILGEARNNLYKDNKISAVLYSEQDISGKYDGVDTISSRDGIYQIEIENRFHNQVRLEANKRHIMRIRYFIKPRGNELELNVMMPEASVYEYYSILYQLALKNDYNIVVSSILPYEDHFWEGL